MKYFGSVTKYGPNDCPAGDNVPNHFKFHAGLNPNVKWTAPADQPKFSVNVPGNAKVRFDSRAAQREQVNRPAPTSRPDEQAGNLEGDES